MKQWFKNICNLFQKDDNWKELINAGSKLSKIRYIIFELHQNNCRLNLTQINEALDKIKDVLEEMEQWKLNKIASRIEEIEVFVEHRTPLTENGPTNELQTIILKEIYEIAKGKK